MHTDSALPLKKVDKMTIHQIVFFLTNSTSQVAFKEIECLFYLSFITKYCYAVNLMLCLGKKKYISLRCSACGERRIAEHFSTPIILFYLFILFF